MQVEWYGQSAFRFEDADGKSVFIDPFGDLRGAASGRGIEWGYPAISGVEADLLLVTHEHRDHNGVDTIAGDPTVLRATAGTHSSPIGDVVGVASEHDPAAGTERGPNTIFAFELGGIRVAHFGDFGQSELRPEQERVLGNVDLLFVPAGDGPTIGADGVVEIVEKLKPRWVVPMHYRTHRVNFLEPLDELRGRYEHVQDFDGPRFNTAELREADGPLLVVPAAP